MAVLLSPPLMISVVVFEYENPTPAGDSKNNIFAAEGKKKKSQETDKLRY